MPYEVTSAFVAAVIDLRVTSRQRANAQRNAGTNVVETGVLQEARQHAGVDQHRRNAAGDQASAQFRCRRAVWLLDHRVQRDKLARPKS